MNIIFSTAITTNSNIFEQLKYMLTSFSLVLGVLVVLSVMTAIIGIFFKFKDKPKAPAKAAAPSVPIAAPKGSDSSKVAALISSAVYATMDGAPHRVLSITPSDASADAARAAIISAAVFTALDGVPHRIESITQVNPWVISGRQAIFNSKNPKK